MTGKLPEMSRRDLIQTAIAGTGMLVVAMAVPAEASAKVAQRSVAYRGAPKGKARCANCTQWQAPSSCKVVSGVISPNGWCSIYVLKA